MTATAVKTSFQKSDFALFDTSARLFQLADFFLLEAISPGAEFLRKMSKFKNISEISGMFTLSIKREIRQFHVVVVQ